MTMADMRMDQEEMAEMMSPSPPLYPYGLCISLCEDELEKLGISVDDVEPGQIIHLHAMAKVTSKSKTEDSNEAHSRVELQITNLAVESEDDENEMYGMRPSRKGREIVSKLYK